MLIVLPDRAILKQIAETYSAKVEALSKECIIRITSDYETCLDILKLIVHTVNNIRSYDIELSKELNVNLYSHKETQNVFLQQVMRSTNTVLELSQWRPHEGQAVHIRVHYLGPEDEDLKDARRMISQIMKPKSSNVRIKRNSSAISSPPLRPMKDVLMPVDVGNALPLIDRATRCLRWRTALAEDMSKDDKPRKVDARSDTSTDPFSEERILRALRAFYKLSEIHHKIAEDTRPHWRSQKTHWDSAILGQVLFPMPVAHAKKSYQPALNHPDRKFATSAPGLMNALEYSSQSHDIENEEEEHLLIHLVPSLSNQIPFPLGVLPELKIRVSLDAATKTSSVSDAWLSHHKELDLLLPSNTLDLRFNRHTRVHAREGELDQRIQNFVDESHLDIWGNGRLKTPAGLSLNLPPHSLRPLNDGRRPNGIEKDIVEYSFAGLEHRSELRIPFRQSGSWADVTYTSIEGGKIGGRRDELALRQLRSGPKEGYEAAITNQSDEDEQYLDSLLKKTKALMNVVENPPNRADYRSMERPQDQDTQPAFVEHPLKEARKKNRQAAVGVRVKAQRRGPLPIREIVAPAKIRKLQF